MGAGRPGGVAPHPLGRDELVDVLEALVVAGVGDHAPVVRHPDGRGLVLEPAQGGVLHGRRAGVLGVDLDDPPEPVHLVLVARLARVEARVDGPPVAPGGAGRRRDAVARVLGRRRRHEVLVEVLLARQHGPPGGRAAGAVVLGAEHDAAERVVLGPQQRVPGGRPGQRERGLHGDASVAARPTHVAPGAAGRRTAQLHHGQPVRGHGDALVLVEHGGVARRREHDVLVRVLVVHDRDRAPAPVTLERDDVEVVVVVAELPLLCRGRLVQRVEVRGVVEQRVTPADQRLPGPPLRHGDGIHGGRHGVDRAEPQRPATRVTQRSRRCRCGGGRRRSQREGERPGPGGTQHAPAAQGTRGDVREVVVVRRVGGFVRAGVAALELARDGASLAAGVRHQSEQAAVLRGGRHWGLPGSSAVGGDPPATLGAR